MTANCDWQKRDEKADAPEAAEYVPFLLVIEGICERLTAKGIPAETFRFDADPLDGEQRSVWAPLKAVEDAGLKVRDLVDREGGNPAFLPFARYIWNGVDAVRAATDDMHALHDACIAERCAEKYAQDGSPNSLILAERMLERARLRVHSATVANERRILKKKLRKRRATAERKADMVRRVESKVQRRGLSLAASYRLVAAELKVTENVVRHAWEQRTK